MKYTASILSAFTLPLICFVFLIPTQSEGACIVNPNGTYVEAENFTGTIVQGGSYSTSTAQSGYLGSGYLLAGSSTSRDCPSAEEGKEYELDFQTTGIYNVWIRARAEGGKFDSVFIGLDGQCIGALNHNRVHNIWVWSNNIQSTSPEGTNTVTVNNTGLHKINVWIRESGHKLDGIYITKGTEIPADASHGETIDPTDCSQQTECVQGETRGCTTGLPGVCSDGTETCDSNGSWGACEQNVQSLPEVCNDGLDNDCDGDVDINDDDCPGLPEICDNGVDDDGDTVIDCLDSDCNGDQACPGQAELIINEVSIDFSSNTIEIIGQNFDNGDTPVVTLGDDISPLSLVSNTSNTIVVDLPAVPDGDYRLAVSTGQGFSHYDEFDSTVGAVGPQGPPGPDDDSWTGTGNVSTAGNVGIGTTDITSPLTVAGTIESTSGGIKFPDGTIQSTASPPIVVAQVPQSNILSNVDSSGIVGAMSSITIGTDGYPVISYSDESNKDIKVAKCGNPSCTSGNIITALDSAHVDKTSIAIGMDGMPVISYQDVTVDDLKVARCGNPACSSGNTVTTVDSTGEVGGSSITIGMDGMPVISYYDYTISDLKVAKCGNPSCSSGNTITALGANAVHFTSIIIGTDGLPLISFDDASTGYYNLKVIKCGNPACSSGNTVSTIDATGSSGSYPSITIGMDGLPVISYSDESTYDIKVAKCGNPACSSGNTIATINYAGSAGSYSSITIGMDGLPVILYYDGTINKLMVAKCGNPACSFSSITTVDSSAFERGSITIGTDGRPVISYQSSGSGDLIVVNCVNALCLNNWIRR